MSTFVGIPRIPTTAVAGVEWEGARRVRMACSLFLDYPDERLEEEIAAVRQELADMPEGAVGPLSQFCDCAQEWGLRRLQEHYVETFDQRRRCALGLTYYTHGDTRDRGQALLAFAELLRRAGFETEREELPDHLPLVLELCALDETGVGEDVLRANREGIEVIRTALHAASSPWALVLDALVATLPEPDERVREAYRRLITQGPPTELVGVGDLAATPSPIPGTVER